MPPQRELWAAGAGSFVVEQEEAGLVQWSDDVLSWARMQLRSIDARVRRTLQERPVMSLLGAAAFGCVLGRVMSRR